MSHRTLNRIVAGVVFVATMVVYFLTLSTTVVFWDVGEFIAAAKLMQVPHPPGSPLFLFGARIAMMIPFAADQAVRAHALSSVLSGLCIMFLYLVIVRLIVNFRGIPAHLFDFIGVYGSAAVGALSLAFGTTYWDNSIEAEVYGASMFFLAVVVWLALRWREKAEEEGNEKYILLIAYMIGLSLGVHLLSLLVIFPVLMIIFFKKYDVTFNTLAAFTVVALLAFGVVYPGIVKELPGMMDGDWAGQKSEIIAWIPWIIIGLVCYGVFVSYRKRQKMLNLALLSIVFIFLGYTTYTSVIIRSNANPPMNENDPSNLARLTSYLGREQYGNSPLFLPRRYSQEPHQQGIYTNYSSEMDYLVRYQLNHMFFRYLFWNYIGAAGDEQDAGVSWKDTWGIPFLIGLLGMYHHFKKDWKMALVFMTAFIILGPVLALYQNQQEPQPRERDYFYVGAYFILSMWISMGILALIDYMRKLQSGEKTQLLLAGGIVGFFVLAVPANLVRINYHEHDRSGNYVAWDYSYNMLQSCERDAILFTNGDNDTFPLWYLQDVEGVRRDVRLVNLSLVNTPWYIHQMKNVPYYKDAIAVPISIADSRIDNIGPQLWEPRKMQIPVPREVLEHYGVTDTTVLRKGAIEWTMRNTMQFGQTKAIRAQDIMVLDIIRTNQWKRPIFFASTCSPDSKIGLDDYLWMDGLAMKLEPKRYTRDEMGINVNALEKNLFDEPAGFSTTPQYGFKFRRVNDPAVYFDENVTRLMLNLRGAFIRLAMYHVNVDSNTVKAMAALDRMETIIPRSKIPLGMDLESDLANFYYRIGRMDKFDTLSTEVEASARTLLAEGQENLSGYYSPYRVLMDVYELRKDYKSELDLLKTLQERHYPNDPGLKQRIEALQQKVQEGAGGSAPTSPPAK